MILGNLIGKSGTNQFSFLVKENAKKFMYVQVMHKEGYNILAQVVEIEKQEQETVAKCNILGYRDEQNILKNLRTPLEPGSEVKYAEDEFIKKTLGLEEDKKGAYIGVLEDRENIKVYLDLNKLITKHVSVLAKSGSGKSFFVGCLLEEIMEKNIPIVVIDPHGEYSTLKYPAEKKENLKRFNIEPKGYASRIIEYSPDVEKNPEARALRLSSRNLSGTELMHLLPAKLSSAQVGLLYAALNDMSRSIDFDQLTLSLQAEENNAKWTLISIVEYLKKLNIFSEVYTTVNEIVQVGKCSIVNLRGIPSELQEIIVYKVVSDLFNARKNGEIPPFFLVVEEAHNYIPERSFGEVKSSSIMRQVIAEGRKFGLGVACISQRPARVDKTILSQCTTQIILKVTNPNDLKSISSSVEGITSETENEIINLHVGTAMIVGVAEMPLFVQIRPRKTRHGGETLDIIGTFSNTKVEEEKTILTSYLEKENKNSKEVINIIKPKVSKEDIKLLVDRKIKKLTTIIVPCLLINCKENNFSFNLLINQENGHIVKDYERGMGEQILNKLEKLSEKENKIFGIILGAKEATAAEVFAKSGLMFSEVYDVVNNLVKKGYLAKTGDKYAFSDALKLLTNLKEKACYEKTEFAGLEYDTKQEVKYKTNEILDFLKRYTNIVNHKECFLIKYDVEF
ncbi:MAG TPA: DUF87 domain-containing protein [Candidatus Nanoarchaeia archaeon]|nr:DUF87 domain-containing protein [Candidatus Nanoarchaeia archaeon]